MTEKQHNKDILSLGYITVLAIAALVYGFTTIPSPTQQRDIKLDHERVSDLGQINYTISEYYTNHQQLPKGLNDLPGNGYATGTPLVTTDPVTHQEYEYIVTSDTSYKLCATFATSSTNEARYAYDENNYTYSSFSEQFRHGKGDTCFIKTVPPQAVAPIGGGSGAEPVPMNGTQTKPQTIKLKDSSPFIPYENGKTKPASPPAFQKQAK
jgi:hypothetical protein